MNEIVEVELKLRDRDCLAFADVYWDWEIAECSSYFGNQWVTERWRTMKIDDIYIISIDLMTDSGEYKSIPHNALTKEDTHIINQHVEEQMREDIQDIGYNL